MMHFRLFKAYNGRLLQAPFKPYTQGNGIRSEAWPVALTKASCPAARPQSSISAWLLMKNCLLPWCLGRSLMSPCRSDVKVSFGLHLNLCLGSVTGCISHKMLRGDGCAPWLEELPVEEGYRSVQVSSVDGEGGCRRRELRAGKCVCCGFKVSGKFSGFQRVNQGGDC